MRGASLGTIVIKCVNSASFEHAIESKVIREPVAAPFVEMCCLIQVTSRRRNPAKV